MLTADFASIHCFQELSAPSAMCRRDGAWQETKVSELVVGDLIQLKGGDVIPADAKVILCLSWFINQTHREDTEISIFK